MNFYVKQFVVVFDSKTMQSAIGVVDHYDYDISRNVYTVSVKGGGVNGIYAGNTDDTDNLYFRVLNYPGHFIRPLLPSDRVRRIGFNEVYLVRGIDEENSCVLFESERILIKYTLNQLHEQVTFILSERDKAVGNITLNDTQVATKTNTNGKNVQSIIENYLNENFENNDDIPYEVQDLITVLGYEIGFKFTITPRE